MFRKLKENTLIPRDQAGLSLVELMVTILVATILIMSATVAITNLAQLNSSARDLALVNSIAENKIEELRSAGFLTLTNGSVDFTSELPGDLNRSASAQYTISDENTALKRIELIISYNQDGAAKVQEFTSFVGELGVGQY